MPDLISIIGLILGGVTLAATPTLLLRGRESGRPLIASVTMIVGSVGFIIGQVFLSQPLGSMVGLAVLVPALGISFPLVRAQLGARTSHVALPPGESESSAELALGESERSDALEERRTIILKTGAPIVALGIGIGVVVGVWTPLLVMTGAVAVTTAALWPGLFRRRRMLPGDSGTAPTDRLHGGEDRVGMLSDEHAESQDRSDRTNSPPAAPG